MGIVGCPLLVADEPGSWEVTGGTFMWDAAELTGFGGRLDILPSEIGHFGSAHPRAKQQGDYRGVDLAACVVGGGGLDATS